MKKLFTSFLVVSMILISYNLVFADKDGDPNENAVIGQGVAVIVQSDGGSALVNELNDLKDNDYNQDNKKNGQDVADFIHDVRDSLD